MEVEPHFDEISIAVLTEQSVAAAAAEYGVSDCQVVAIVNNYCRRGIPPPTGPYSQGGMFLIFASPCFVRTVIVFCHCDQALPRLRNQVPSGAFPGFLQSR